MKRTLLLVIFLVLMAVSGLNPRPVAGSMTGPAPPKPEIRAFWVDGFHAGIRTAEEAERLVGEAKRANINALFVQVRRRADSFYSRTFEPPVDDPAYDPRFDALSYILDLAHREGIEVHAWLNATPVWSGRTLPRSPRHILNRQGMSRGKNTWLTLTIGGEPLFPVGYFLDPGHPDAAQYLTDVFLNVIRNYPVDGIHFDYIRYPETRERVPRGSTVGYNPTNLDRFRKVVGRRGIPAPSDSAWMAWRRQQVTQLVRKIYIEAKAINPRIKVSSAAVAWGRPPSNEADFLESVPGQMIFQDWHAWMQEGIIDLVVPMNYARESNPMTKAWFDGWIRWEKEHKHGRQLAIGLGNFLNRPEATLAQVERARRNVGETVAEGLALYSYATPATRMRSRGPAPADTSDLLEYLVRGPLSASGPFRNPVPIPPMDWIEHPQAGWLAGIVRDSKGKPADGAAVALRVAGWGPFRELLRTTTDGTGYFGFANLPPGPYEVRLERGPAKRAVEVEVRAGQVARVQLGPELSER